MNDTNAIKATAQSSNRSAGRPADASGTFLIGGDISVRRLGFGTMRLTGAGIWGVPADYTEGFAALGRAVGLGINLFYTAASYGPEVGERPIAEALNACRADVLIYCK